MFAEGELGGDLGAWAWDSRILTSDRKTLLVDILFMFVLAHATLAFVLEI